MKCVIKFCLSSRSRLAQFQYDCEPEEQSAIGCKQGNYAACLIAYTGLIGNLYIKIINVRDKNVHAYKRKRDKVMIFEGLYIVSNLVTRNLSRFAVVSCPLKQEQGRCDAFRECFLCIPCKKKTYTGVFSPVCLFVEKY